MRKQHAQNPAEKATSDVAFRDDGKATYGASRIPLPEYIANLSDDARFYRATATALRKQAAHDDAQAVETERKIVEAEARLSARETTQAQTDEPPKPGEQQRIEFGEAI